MPVVFMQRLGGCALGWSFLPARFLSWHLIVQLPFTTWRQGDLFHILIRNILNKLCLSIWFYEEHLKTERLIQMTHQIILSMFFDSAWWIYIAPAQFPPVTFWNSGMHLQDKQQGYTYNLWPWHTCTQKAIWPTYLGICCWTSNCGN